VRFVRLAQVNQCQHHEDECLEQHDQDVENCPDRTSDHVTNEAECGRGRSQQCDQQEQQFACIHVAEQSHAQGHGLGGEFDDVEQQVERSQPDAERCSKQFVDEAARALDLDAVVQHQGQHAQGDAQGAVQVGGRDDAVVHFTHAEDAEDARSQVDRQEVQRVHQGHPDEHGQRHRSNEAAVAVHDGLGLVFDHLDHHLDEGLEAARHARGCLAGSQEHEEACDDATEHGPEHGIHVDDGEIDDLGLVMRGEVSEVVDDVFGGCWRVLSGFYGHGRCLNSKMK